MPLKQEKGLTVPLCPYGLSQWGQRSVEEIPQMMWLGRGVAAIASVMLGGYGLWLGFRRVD